MVLAIIVFGLIASIAGEHQNFNITKLNQNPGAVFDQCEDIYGINGHWHLISEMNMGIYYKAYKSIPDDTDQLKILCEKITRGSNETQCENLLVKVNEHLNIINENNIIIKSGGDVRGKRNVFLEALAGSVLGYLGSAVIDYIRDDSNRRELNDLSEKTQLMSELLNSHTSILNMTTNIQENTINEANSVIKHTVNLLQNESNFFNIHNEVHWISKHVIITMNEFRKLQDAIIKGHHEINTGINAIWIPYDKMHNQISLIMDQLPTGTRLYGETAEEILAAIYKLSTTRMLLTKEKIFFLFEIPLLRSSAFKCFEIIPIPIAVKNKFIWIQNLHQYLWLSKESEHYALASKEQMTR